MKHYFSGMLIALSLALVLVLGVVALAENGAEAPELPAAGDLQTPAEAPEAAPAPDGDTQQTQDNTALQEALQAYRAAKESDREQALQDELDGYVAAGKLTQAQADLIMDYYKEQQSMRNGTCPGCGYQFQNGKGGRMNGNGFGRGGKGGQMNGGMGGRGGRMNGDFGFQNVPGAPNGMSAQGDMQVAPHMVGDEGI